MSGIYRKTLPFTEPSMRMQATELVDQALAGGNPRGLAHYDYVRRFIRRSVSRSLPFSGDWGFSEEERREAVETMTAGLGAHTLLIHIPYGRRGEWTGNREARMAQIHELWERQGWPGAPEDHRLQFSTGWDWLREGSVQSPRPFVPFVRLYEGGYWPSGQYNWGSDQNWKILGLTTTHSIGGR